jgi:Ca-activated chloride channel family protein
LKFEISDLRFVLTPLVAGLLLAAALAPASVARQDAAGGVGDARAEAGRVVVMLGASDREGRPFEGLKPEDLRVTVEGAESRIVSLARGSEEPLHVAVMLDASVSQERILPFAREATAQFFKGALRPGVDDAAVVSFTNRANVVQALTGDAGALRRAVVSVEVVVPKGYVPGGIVVGKLPRTGSDFPGSTALWDSLAAVCGKVFAGAKGGRRAVVLVTDGVDTSSRSGADEAVERLLREGVAVYSVGVGDTKSFDGVEKDGLRKVSERTGGRALFPKDEEHLADSFEQVRQELRSPYAVELAPQTLKGGKLHKLRIEIVNPGLRKQGVELAYPRSLYAAPPPPARP